LQLYDSSVISVSLITSSTTVPTGKKWKITSVLPSNSIISSGDFSIKINGLITFIGGVSIGQTGSTGGVFNNQYFMLNNEIWLPEGSTIEPNTNILGITIQEY
jgi:hypothetical protein